MRTARYILSLLLIVGVLAIPAPSHAQVAVGVSIRIGPPALPVYAQPICPGPSYIWIPGYWAYGDDDYFWVPGTWVIAPEPGLLWTPGYWGWNEGFYVWHAGYWGPTVGFYGGINYGFGYPGVGFYGGYWHGGNYYYNRSVTNVNVTVIHNVYERRVVNEHVNRVSFNGGPSGIHARPDRDELRAEHERHIPMTREQTHHFEAARGDRDFRASVNHGRPEVAATPRAGEFHGRGPVDNGRMEHTNRPPEDRNASNRSDRSSNNNGRNDSDRPPSVRGSNGRSSNPSLDGKHQREADKMQRQQDADRQKLQQRHDQEQQKFSRQNVNQQRQDQLRQRQQQQTDQMNRKHDQQSQKLQQRQQQETQKQENRKPNNNHPH
jgi:YXWGXW repeat-containing protein